VSQPKVTPRDVAVWALSNQPEGVTSRFEHLAERAELSDADRALARELALGVVRRKRTLQHVLQAFLAKPDKKLPGALEEILLVGLYQILFLSRVPDFAVVNEAVDQTVRFRHRRQSGLVNGLLRGIIRNLSEPIPGRPELASKVLPMSPDRSRTFQKALFSDPSVKPASYLAEAFSLSDTLANRWLERTGSLDNAVELALHANVRAPIILRVNRLKATVEEVLKSLEADGIQVHTHPNGLSVVLAEQVHLSSLKAFDNGWVQVQDPTATAVGVAAQPQPEMNVLDFCAAPGTKTTHLAELMSNRGSITAVDVSQQKLDRITSNSRRLGLSIITTKLADEISTLSPRSFDLALVDVPCSNTGVLSRRPEARWRFGLQELARLVKQQQQLVLKAAELVCPGGRLVYSTCSIEPEENQQLVSELPSLAPRLKLTEEQLSHPAGADEPSRWHDGGYYAVFEVQ